MSGLWNWASNEPAVSGAWLARHSQPATSWWRLNEPESRADWEALGWFNSLVREARNELNQEKPGLGNLITTRSEVARAYSMYNSLNGNGGKETIVYNKTFTDVVYNENHGEWWSSGPGYKFASQRALDSGGEWRSYGGLQGRIGCALF
jgi:hypothetical protein